MNPMSLKHDVNVSDGIDSRKYWEFLVHAQNGSSGVMGHAVEANATSTQSQCDTPWSCHFSEGPHDMPEAVADLNM